MVAILTPKTTDSSFIYTRTVHKPDYGYQAEEATEMPVSLKDGLQGSASASKTFCQVYLKDTDRDHHRALFRKGWYKNNLSPGTITSMSGWINLTIPPARYYTPSRTFYTKPPYVKSVFNYEMDITNDVTNPNFLTRETVSAGGSWSLWNFFWPSCPVGRWVCMPRYLWLEDAWDATSYYRMAVNGPNHRLLQYGQPPCRNAK